MGSFIGYSEISIFNPQSKYFYSNVNFQLFKNAIFGGVMSKIEFGQIWRYGYVLYYGFGSKWVIHNFSSSISADSADLSHNNKKIIF